MPSPIAVLLATLFGLLTGMLSRRWLGRLARGAVIRPGLIEIPSALISGLGMVLARSDPRWLPLLWIGVLGVPLTAVDLKHHRLPDAITLPAIPITMAVVTVAGLIGDGSPLRALLGGLLLGGAFYALALAAPRAMGRGDAKLAFSVGIALGYLSWSALLIGVFLAFLLGSLAGLVGVAVRRLRLTSHIAFGPAMMVACWLVLAVPELAGAGPPGVA